MEKDNIFCRGSYVLGTACGQCSRCKEELDKILKGYTKGKPPLTFDILTCLDSAIRRAVQAGIDRDAKQQAGVWIKVDVTDLRHELEQVIIRARRI